MIDPDKVYDKPNGLCSQCSAPLNECMVGGYKVHDGEYAVSAAINWSREQVLEAIYACHTTIEKLHQALHDGRYRKVP